MANEKLTIGESVKIEKITGDGFRVNAAALAAGNGSTKWVNDITDMHTKFGVNEVIDDLDREELKAFLQFRIDFLQEELDEMKAAGDSDDVVDALIDLCVVAIGTLDAFRVNADLSWNRVHEKNMQKEPGIKPNRPNPLGLPDLIKPEGWTSPTHVDNVGLLDKIFD